ncbi:hypothetical protein C8Q76DRAFT_321755 [Earliella scabrosa]|nr:hypothetical protein C8Q76DRAFT_321755 [Earliella scabrosa]
MLVNGHQCRIGSEAHSEMQRNTLPYFCKHLHTWGACMIIFDTERARQCMVMYRIVIECKRMSTQPRARPPRTLHAARPLVSAHLSACVPACPLTRTPCAALLVSARPRTCPPEPHLPIRPRPHLSTRMPVVACPLAHPSACPRTRLPVRPPPACAVRPPTHPSPVRIASAHPFTCPVHSLVWLRPHSYRIAGPTPVRSRLESLWPHRPLEIVFCFQLVLSTSAGKMKG